jgi:MerR family transcriptional regulator/heat shock protein HspR
VASRLQSDKEEILKTDQHYPLYTIGVVAEMLGIHPETIRVWESSGAVVPPQRRSGKRFYSENDLKRLRFIRKLTGEGLTQRAIIYYLRLYPCWKTSDCTGCRYSSSQTGSTKPCWQEEDGYCRAANLEDPCAGCPLRTGASPVPDESDPESLTTTRTIREP